MTRAWRSGILVGVALVLLVACADVGRGEEEEEEEATVTEEVVEKADEGDEVVYVTPKEMENPHFMELFDDEVAFEKKWIRSQAKKEGVDDDIAKYNGLWALEGAEKIPLVGDRGLVLKSRAKHAAISAPLKRPFDFSGKPLVVQYEVNLQNGQECGGAYIKLLTAQNGGVDLKNFNDKTPYTIMFGPDKCGNDHKLHFIFRHVNPINGEVEEKHAKASHPREKFEEPFKDKKPHLYTLVVRPDNTYDISIDQEVINTGSLLDDFSPPVNPPREIDDPEDSMPKDWDEREKIPDPEATKPEDWDEDAPMQITDPEAVKPKGWLDDEPEMVPDPTSEKPEDWDEEMDGEWEAALINNPLCAEAPGCGEWRAPMIDNPAYKGKWKAPLIDNPNYRGKWKPRTIPNPGFFEDLEPYKMKPIGAVGIELWSMSDDILFDNIIITDSIAEANQLAAETFDLKIMKLEKGQVGVFRRIIRYSNKNPWLYGIYVLLVAIPVVLIFTFCCAESKDAKDAKRKKTDEPTEDDPHAEDEAEATAAKPEEEEEAAGGSDGAAGGGGGGGEESADVESDTAKDAKEDEEEEEEKKEDEEEEEETKSDKEEESQPRTSPRLRKSRRE